MRLDEALMISNWEITVLQHSETEMNDGAVPTTMHYFQHFTENSLNCGKVRGHVISRLQMKIQHYDWSKEETEYR